MPKPKQPPKPTPPPVIKGPIQITDERALIIPLGFPDPPGPRPTPETEPQAAGRVLTHLGRVRRNEEVPCVVVPLESSRIEWVRIGDGDIPRSTLRPRGAPLKHPAMLERLRADLVAHSTHSRRQRAARLGLPFSTLRRYLQRLALQPR